MLRERELREQAVAGRRGRIRIARSADSVAVRARSGKQPLNGSQGRAAPSAAALSTVPAATGGHLAALALSLIVALGSTTADPASPLGPQAPQNPATAANGAATMHGDTAWSGTTRHPGPGTSAIDNSRTAPASACPTMVVGSDGYVIRSGRAGVRRAWSAEADSWPWTTCAAPMELTTGRDA
ncbi:hypothetical protein ABZ615_17995 [Streptomyces sp. NPDC007325]|uniref:hypothetical protein n=1 Tax=Streptomyces sp. NPDC007325 TaxID=3154588 RepID=UPI0034023A74